MMLEKLEKLVEEDEKNKYKLMRDVIPVTSHRSWNKTYLKNCVVYVISEIKSYQRSNKI